jgi:hypothetical protein
MDAIPTLIFLRTFIQMAMTSLIPKPPFSLLEGTPPFNFSEEIVLSLKKSET